jgi:hypothetical protein
VVPLEGAWRDAEGALAPPFFFPAASSCEAPAVPTERALRECLAARGAGGTLFFMGNSFARGMAFAVQAFLARARGGAAGEGGGEAPPRAEQIRLCPKHIDFSNDLTYSCELPLQDAAARAAEVAAAANASTPPPPPLVARVLWRHFWAAGGAPFAAAADRDFCTGQPSWRACYAAFFGAAGGGEGAVLFSTLGRGYAEAAARGGADFFAPATQRAVVADAEEFLASGVFNGTVVWTTQTRADSNCATWASFNPHMDAINEVVAPALAARGVVVVDQANFWRRGVRHRADEWVDGIHPPPEGYLAAFFIGMNALCDFNATGEG